MTNTSKTAQTTTQAIGAEEGRSLWSAAVHRWETACRTYETACEGDDQSDDFMDPIHDEWANAWDALMHTPAPDLHATIYKLRCLISENFADHEVTAMDDRAALQPLLDCRLAEGASPLLALLQDAYRQAGIAHPLTTLRPTRSQ